MNNTLYVKVIANEEGSYTFTLSENNTGIPVVDMLTATLPNGVTAGLYYQGLEYNSKINGNKLELLDDSTALALLKMVQSTFELVANQLKSLHD